MPPNIVYNSGFKKSTKNVKKITKKVLTIKNEKYIMSLVKKITKVRKEDFLMKINVLAVKELIKDKFRNNQTWFAEEIKIDAHYLNQILLGNKKATSPKACRGVIDYCKKNNLNINDFIIF